MKYWFTLLLFVPLVAAATRCDDLRTKLGADLVDCWDFEQPADAHTGTPGVFRPSVTIDTATAASGSASLRLETISMQEARLRKTELTPDEAAQALVMRNKGGKAVSGDAVFSYAGLTDEQALALYLKQLQWTMASQSNSSWVLRKWSQQFGPGNEFWLQVRIRENAAFYVPNWGGDGPKKWIIAGGDRTIDFVGALREPLPSTSGAGALIKLAWDGDPLRNYPKFGVVEIEGESITYVGVNLTENALVIGKRATPAIHASGAATLVRHLDDTASGCVDLEIPMTEDWKYIPRAYHSCGTKDRVYESWSLPMRRMFPRNTDGTCPNVSSKPVSATECESISVSDVLVQSGRRGTWNEAKRTWEGGCLQSRVKVGDYSGCVVDGPDVWATWTVRMRIGTMYKNDRRYRHDTLIQIWREDVLVQEFDPDARHPRVGAPTPEECRARATSVVNVHDCLTGYDLVQLAYNGVNASLTGPRSASDPGARYGAIHIGMQSWRRQYSAPDDPRFCCHPPVIRWFDDLVIAKADPGLPNGRPLLPQPLTVGVVEVTGGAPPYTITVKDRDGRIVERVQ